MPPALERTDIHEKIPNVLRIASGDLSNLAELERKGEIEKESSGAAAAFGELERLVTQKLLDCCASNCQGGIAQ